MTKYILVVDDQPLIRGMIQEALLNFGYRAKSVANGRECLKIARSAAKPSLILLDYHMPQMTGFEVLSALRKDGSTCEIPVILISAEENLEEKAARYGFNAVLAKPLDVNALVVEIHKILG